MCKLGTLAFIHEIGRLMIKYSIFHDSWYTLFLFMAHFIIIFTPLFDDVYEIRIQMGAVVEKEEETVTF